MTCTLSTILPCEVITLFAFSWKQTSFKISWDTSDPSVWTLWSTRTNKKNWLKLSESDSKWVGFQQKALGFVMHSGKASRIRLKWATQNAMSACYSQVWCSCLRWSQWHNRRIILEHLTYRFCAFRNFLFCVIISCFHQKSLCNKLAHLNP